jgi:hypothetical protein
MGYIFISYSHKDKDYVHKLQTALMDEGFEVWIDDRIDYGTEWPKVIQKQLDNCDAFIIVVSENAYESKWVQNEVARAGRKKKPFFPLLLNGEPWLSVEATQYFDVRSGSLPSSNFLDRLEKFVVRHKPARNLAENILKREFRGFNLGETQTLTRTIGKPIPNGITGRFSISYMRPYVDHFRTAQYRRSMESINRTTIRDTYNRFNRPTLLESPRLSVPPQISYISHWEYFDFFIDGTVQFASQWKNRFYKRKFWDWLLQRSIKEEGTYSISGMELKIRVMTSKGSVDYEGTYASHQLTLNIFSHMTGKKEEGVIYHAGMKTNYEPILSSWLPFS